MRVGNVVDVGMWELGRQVDGQGNGGGCTCLAPMPNSSGLEGCIHPWEFMG